LGIYGSGLVSLTTLIQLPNATFILTYLGGCAAGIRLLKGSRTGVTISWISFVATAIVFPFAGWAVLYPVVIVVLFGLFNRKRHNGI
jgi:amino acid efflux transporter